MRENGLTGTIRRVHRKTQQGIKGLFWVFAKNQISKETLDISRKGHSIATVPGVS